MKLFGLGGKKQKPASMPSATTRVVSLSSQGLSEPEIIQILREEGYTPIQVDGAMREALRGAASGAPVQPRQAPQRYPAPPGQDYGAPGRQPVPAQREYAYPARRPPQPRPYPPEPEFEEDIPGDDLEEEPLYPGQREPVGREIPQPPQADFDDFKRRNRDLGFPELPEVPGREEEQVPEELPEDEEFRPLPRIARRDRPRPEIRRERRQALEELTEGVVEEKWSEFRKRMDETNSRFHLLNDRISGLEQKIIQAQGGKRDDLAEIESKLDSYKQSMDEIEAKMESIEKAMKDSLTPMLQTLRSLSETIKTLKERKG